MKIQNYPSIEQVIASLGKHTETSEVISLMRTLGVSEKNLKSVAGLNNLKSWSDSDFEICLDFEDINSLMDEPSGEIGEGPWVLTGVVFWSDLVKETKRTYAGPLPYGVDFSMNKVEIQALFSQPGIIDNERVDSWQMCDHKLVINYDVKSHRVRSISLKMLSGIKVSADSNQAVKPHVKIQDYFALLGTVSSDPKVEHMFEELQLKRRPQLARPPRSPYEVILPMNSLGISLAFTEKNYYTRSAKRLHGKSRTVIFDKIVISSGVPEVMRCYEGEMPFGVEWTDTRKIVREKMAALGHANKLHAHTRDAWWLDGYIVRMNYASEKVRLPIHAVVNEISIVVNKNMPAEVPSSFYPSIEQLRNLFGKSAWCPEFHEAFTHFEPEKLIADIPLAVELQSNTVDRSIEYGFVISIDPNRPASDGSPGITGFEMKREGLGGAHPWLGDLPYSIHFDDSPSVLQTKLGKKANQWQELQVWGQARWYFDHEFVRVQFDNFNNCIESVSIFISGYKQQ